MAAKKNKFFTVCHKKYLIGGEDICVLVIKQERGFERLKEWPN